MKLGHVLRTVLFLFLLSGSILMASRILAQKKSAYYKDDFFRTEREYDILFFGSSHMHEGVDPLALWQDHGLASYNLASSAESMQVTYYVVKAALEKYRPRVIMADAFKISDAPDTLDERYGFVHESIDALPFGRTKLEAVRYVARFLPEGIFPFLSPLYAFHGRYGELTEEDFRPGRNRNMGAFILTGIVPTDRRTLFTEETKELRGGEGVRAYRNLLKLCREKGVAVVLTDLPSNGSSYREESLKRTNALMEETVRAGGYALRFDRERTEGIGLDYDLDFGDQTHLNHMGSRKVTNEIGRWLKEVFPMADHRGDPAYAGWEEILGNYTEERIRLLKDREEAVSWLFQVEDPAYEVRVSVRNPDWIPRHCGLSFCLSRMGIRPEEAGNDVLGGHDMKAEVRRSDTGEWRALGYFDFDSGRNEFRTAP